MSAEPHLDQIVEEEEKKEAKIAQSDDREDDNGSNLQAATPESYVTVSENPEDIDYNDCRRKDGDPNRNAHVHLPEIAQKEPEKQSNLVDIRGIPKRDLIRALWEKSKVAGFYTMCGLKPPLLDIEAAMNHVGYSSGYFDYLDGRVMKCSLSRNEVNVGGYDRDNGSGAFASVVEDLRKEILAKKTGV
ncbi:hypothetical protein FQN53_006925 [Emmonsiellopsis sp. PD_33]|nr:hypothetical protein FQN53_006925 [Emmonsiellopsis sp. PD_33]